MNREGASQKLATTPGLVGEEDEEDGDFVPEVSIFSRNDLKDDLMSDGAEG